MRNLIVTIIILTTLFAIGEEVKSKYRITSVIRLLANPEKVRGTFVQTEGYLRFGHRSAFIYVDELSARNGLLVNAVPIEFGEANLAAIQAKFNDKYVMIRGRFIAYDPAEAVASVGYIGAAQVILMNEYFSD